MNKSGRSDLIFNTGYKPCGLKQTANQWMVWKNDGAMISQ